MHAPEANLGAKSTLRDDGSMEYWNGASRVFIEGKLQTLWRSHSDAVNITLLQDWIAARQFCGILKTDLFDEAVSEGLYPLLSRHGQRIHGIDIAAEPVNAAMARYPELDGRCADVRKLPFGDQYFELIVSNSTLDHFRSTAEIDLSLSELFRVLKDGGELFISLDNLQNPMVWLRSKLPASLLKKLHMVPYLVGKTHTRRGLISALERAGFRVLETRPVMHCPRVLAVAVAGVLEKYAAKKQQQGFLAMLSKFEHLAKLPTKNFSGHFIAVRALKPQTDG